jgi:serine protease Do
VPALCILLVNASPAEINSAFINSADTIKPSVVNITVYKKVEEKGTSVFRETAFASGTIISRDGYIVTNHHVASKGDIFRITDHLGRRYEIEPFSPGTPYLSDRKTDIALLKIDLSAGAKPVPALFHDSNNLREGEWVIAVGNPFGLKMSVTAGIVSSSGRDNIGFTDIEDFIQTDVSINPGNSGGPLVNLDGKLVGINTAIRSVSGGYQGISFAIPSNIVKRVCSDLIRHGRVKRGWIGFFAKERITGDYSEESEVEVISVIKGSPADAAGLKKGDIIRDVDGSRITSLGALLKEIGNRETGSQVMLTAAREGKLYRINLLLREKEEYKKIRKISGGLFSRYGIEIDENSYGECVVSYASPAAVDAGIKNGDIIVSINGKKVAGIDTFIESYEKRRGRISTLGLWRDGYTRTLKMDTDYRD